MKERNIKLVKSEAKRFLECLSAAEAKVTRYGDVAYYRGIESAAAKRASMDLTRALAKLRSAG